MVNWLLHVSFLAMPYLTQAAMMHTHASFRYRIFRLRGRQRGCLVHSLQTSTFSKNQLYDRIGHEGVPSPHRMQTVRNEKSWAELSSTYEAATPKFEVKRHGTSGHSNDCIAAEGHGYAASIFAGAAMSSLCLPLNRSCRRSLHPPRENSLEQHFRRNPMECGIFVGTLRNPLNIMYTTTDLG